MKNSTSISCIWQSIRLHYGFQSTGVRFIDFNSIKLEPGERPEDLFQRLQSFVEDNLLLFKISYLTNPIEDIPVQANGPRTDEQYNYPIIIASPAEIATDLPLILIQLTIQKCSPLHGLDLDVKLNALKYLDDYVLQ